MDWFFSLDLDFYSLDFDLSLSIWLQTQKFTGIFQEQAPVPSEVLTLILLSNLCTDTPSTQKKSDRRPLLWIFVRGRGVCTQAISIPLSYFFTKYSFIIILLNILLF